MFSNGNSAKICPKFYCENCDYATSKKSSYDDHLLSAKHAKSTIVNEKSAKLCSKFYCEICNKSYKDNSGLWRHKKSNKCVKECQQKEPEPNVTELLLKLLKENLELQKQLISQSKEPTIINNTTNTMNTTNNHFNLQIYLNETCKDAINIKEFVDGLEVKLKDLEDTARLGYSEGVSRIFIKGLNELEVNKRPIHCSDAKRETLYIKRENEWIKEDTSRSELKNAIKAISKKNVKQIFEWQKKYPEYNNPESKENDKYQKMIFNAMSGSSTEEQMNNMDKIIKNVIKETIIVKTVS
jgi:hypothetical protein